MIEKIKRGQGVIGFCFGCFFNSHEEKTIAQKEEKTEEKGEREEEKKIEGK